MDPIVTGAIIGAGAHIGTNLLGMGHAAKMDKKNLEQRRKEYAEHKRQFDLNYQHQQRQYTHGIRDRVADLTAAGLHPTLAAGQPASAPMAVSGGSPKSTPLRSQRAESIMQMAAQVQNIANIAAQNRLLRAQAAHVNADTERVKADTEGLKGRETRSQEMHALEQQLKRAGIRAHQAQALVKEIEGKYMQREGMRMPQRRPEIGEIIAAIERVIPLLPRQQITNLAIDIRDFIRDTGVSAKESFHEVTRPGGTIDQNRASRRENWEREQRYRESQQRRRNQ
ncbi:DNA pilot protein [Tortoise microvirus 25]|nr:DNA pilot protein [Tortoise microvirus 25]